MNAVDGGPGYTALMLAAFHGRTEAVEALMSAPGLDVNAANYHGDTALMLAEKQGHTTAVTALQHTPARKWGEALVRSKW